MKVCTRCEEPKGLEMFSRKGQTPSGDVRLSSWCKECHREYNRVRRSNEHVRHLERTQAAQYMVARRRDPDFRARERRYDADRTRTPEVRAQKQQSARARYAADPQRKLLASSRRRAAQAATTVERLSADEMRENWAESDIYGCVFCGSALLEGVEVDHFYPLQPAAGVQQGPHALWNLVPSCAPCNRSKGNRDPWEFLERALAERGIDLDDCLTNIREVS